MQIYLQTLYEPYGMYSASVPVQYIYTSTPPLDRTESAEIQCLYSTANYILTLRALLPVMILNALTVILILYTPCTVQQ